MSGEWFQRWFGESYLALYPHRDEAEAGAGVALFERVSALTRGARVLDLACGGGRHLERLRGRGFRATGMDLSMPLLRSASERQPARGHLVRGDMRQLPFGGANFDGLVNFFTSFGYFETEAEDRAVVREMSRVLRPGGRFLIDYLNAAAVRRELVPRSEGSLGGRHVVQTRWLEENRVVKRIEIFDDEADAEAGGSKVFHERVRLYEPGALTGLLEAEGLDVERRFGDYDGVEFGASANRLLLAGRRR